MEIVEVIRNINRGGFGIIDEVVCDDGKHYARKEFCPSDIFRADESLCEKLKVRFVREVKTQKILPNDYFIPIVFDDLDSDIPYFIMPLAEAVYTEEIRLCKKEKRYPEGLGDILNALEFLHDKALVHRDLKPQNILKHDGIWKLADFGLITQDKEIHSQTITSSKQAFGTTLYCAPEQILEFNRITPQADIYSFGAILHDIFSDEKRVPYSELTAPDEIGYIIAKCTKYKKEQRFQSINSIRVKLLTILSINETNTNNEADSEWIDEFLNVTNWNENTLENFVFYIKLNEPTKDIIFHQISDEILQFIYKLNKELFNDLAIIYLEWVYNNYFKFDYCDVVVNNIYSIYNLTKDIEVKSKCAISSAQLGRLHNRWYVMEYVVRMCSPEIEDNIAYRIALEIELDEINKTNFKYCLQGIKKTTSAYHKNIEVVL